MAIVTKPWSARQALDRGFEFYDVTITDWGDIGAGADPANQNGVQLTPLSDFPAQAIAVAPESVIDRCFLTYNPLQTIATLAGVQPPQSVLLGKDQPYFGRLPAEYSVAALINDFFTDAFINASGVGAPWGTALPGFIAPSLTLRLYLVGSGLAPHGRPRASRCDNVTSFSGPGTEDFIVAFPCHGRRRARVTVANTVPASTVAVRVGRVSSCAERNAVPPPLAFSRSIETNAVAATPIAGAATNSFLIDPLLGEYITLYGEATVGAPSLTYVIEIED